MARNLLEDFFVFVVGPFLGLLSAGLLIPFFTKLFYQYYAKNHAFGSAKFNASSVVSSYYGAFLVSLIASLLTLSAFAILLSLPFWGLQLTYDTVGPQDAALTLGVIFLSLGFVVLTFFLFNAMCRNILVRKLVLTNGARFKSDINPFRLLWIVVSNFIAIILSFGLLIPWAAVRHYRYLTKMTQYAFDTDVNEFIDENLGKTGSFGEEFADFEGIDISI